MQRFAAHLSFELPALFGFLFDPAVDATNWRAEQALRPTVVKLQVNGGNRSARGAETQHVLTSVVRPRSNAGSMPSRSWSISYAPRTHGLPPPHSRPHGRIAPVTSHNARRTLPTELQCARVRRPTVDRIRTIRGAST